MTAPWTAPPVDRTESDLVAGERTALEQLLDYGRATLLTKCAGLTGEQLARRSCPPSTLSLLGLLRHMTEVERWWFRMYAAHEDIELVYCAIDDMDDFEAGTPDSAPGDYATHLAELDAARAAVADMALDHVVTHGREGRRDRDVRWLYLHMIEEYARHNGHADLLREAIDGATGD